VRQPLATDFATFIVGIIMNYRHLYHAGNFADVMKHCVLIILLEALQRKAKPFCYLDTHAGVGLYNLTAPEAQKTNEFQTGIDQIILHPAAHPLLERYRQIVLQHNSTDSLLFYPGSPLIAKAVLRTQDRMVLTELHTQDSHALKQLFQHDKQVAVHHLDGYYAMKAFLPPAEKRGLVLIDPPYEEPAEWEHIIIALQRALTHWRMGTFALWYPIKRETVIRNYLNQLLRHSTEILQLEILRAPNDVDNRLNGCGMIIVNPPWQVQAEIESMLFALQQALSLHAVQVNREKA